MTYLPIPGIEQPPDQSFVWRYVDLCILLALARFKRFRLSRLDSFPDPWEGIVRKVTRGPLRSANSETVVAGYSYLRGDTDSPDRRRALVLCWCKSEFENAAFWERYGRDGLGIAIKSRALHLRRMVEKSTWGLHFGSVRYIDTLDRDEPETGPPLNLFLKDRSYAFEQKVRILRYTPIADADPGGALLDVELVPAGFNCEILLHPKSPAWFGELVRDVMSDYGHGYEVQRSALGGTVSQHEVNL